VGEVRPRTRQRASARLAAAVAEYREVGDGGFGPREARASSVAERPLNASGRLGSTPRPGRTGGRGLESRRFADRRP
jgi:hypothetical protein